MGSTARDQVPHDQVPHDQIRRDRVQRDWVLAEEPVPVRLMATIWADTDGVHDDFAAPADLDDWLDAIGADRHGTTSTAAEFRAARALRDAARRLAAFVTADERPPAGPTGPGLDEAITVVNAAARALPVAQLSLAGTRLDFAAPPAGTPVTAGLATVAAGVQQLLAGDAPVLRACTAPGCVLYFAKTHPRREWCSIACGNRARAARHYRTTRAARTTS